MFNDKICKNELDKFINVVDKEINSSFKEIYEEEDMERELVMLKNGYIQGLQFARDNYLKGK